MMARWSLALEPLVSWPVLIALALAAALTAVALIWRGGWRSLLRVGALSLLVAALLDPWRSRSTAIGEGYRLRSWSTGRHRQAGGSRPADRSAQRQIAEQLAGLGDVEPRIVEVQSGAGTDGTRMFDALARTLSDVPAERVAGAIMITDGQVHDVPETLQSLGLTAPLHVPRHRTGARDRPPDQADRGPRSASSGAIRCCGCNSTRRTARVRARS